MIVPVAGPSAPQHELPVTLTGVLASTRTVVTGNHATDVFADTTTLLGTWMMSGRLFDSWTCAPCVAGPLSVIFPVAGPVPPTLDGKNWIDTIEGPVGGGVVVMVAESVEPPAVPTITENVPTPLCGCTSVVTVNVALVAPAGMVTVAGTRATVRSVLVSETGVSVPTPDAIVAVPIAFVPPTTRLGETVRLVRTAPVGGGGVTDNDVTRLTPPYAAVIATRAKDAIVPAVAVNVAVEVPAGIVTLAGTDASDGSALDNVTVPPPTGAGPESVIVPFDVAPLAIVVGENVSVDRVVPDGTTFNTAVCVTPFAFAEMAAKSGTATGWLVIVNVAVVDPSATVTGDETVAAARLLLITPTDKPPTGATVVRVMVPVAVAPALTVLGEIEID